MSIKQNHTHILHALVTVSSATNCPQGQILWNNHCLLFHQSFTTGARWKKKNTGKVEQKKLKTLLDALCRVSTTPIKFQLHCKLQTHSYLCQHGESKGMTESTKTRNYQTLSIEMSPTINELKTTFQNQIVQCQSRQIISATLLHSNLKCELMNTTHLYACSMNKTKHMYHQCINCTKPDCHCLPMYFLDGSGHCQPFRGPRQQPTSVSTPVKSQSETLQIGSDCSEEDLYSQVKGKIFIQTVCKEKGEIPCTYGCSRCFPVFALCIYELDLKGQLMYCPSGSHLKQCKELECNNMMKCTENYCIPFK